MITKEFLSQCSDEQVNKGVAWLTIKEWGYGSEHKRKCIDYYCSQGLLNSVAAGNVNYCTNPNDIMPIAFANWITVKPMNNSMWPNDWEAFENKAIGAKSYNTNPLRAICEVYILMSVNK